MKRRKLLQIITIIAIVSIVGSGISTSAKVNRNSVNTQYDLVKLDKNLIKDSSFESRSNWKKAGDGTFTNYEGTAATGNWCGLLPSNSGNAAVYQVVNVKPNTEYVAKAKIQLGKEGSTAFLNAKTPDLSTLIKGAEKTVTCSKDQEWQYQDVELRFNSGNNNKIALAVMKWTEDTNSATYKGQVYVDDISLFEKNSSDDNYDIVWADDFNESNLDRSKWEYELGSIRGIEQQHYVNDKDNVFLRDNGNGGELVLKATDRPIELQYNNPRDNSRRVIYNSGSIRTHGKSEFLYGRIEMKAKLPKGQSVFPAFWTLGSDFTLDGDINSEQGYGWARCGEIDIMELTGSGEGGKGNKTVYQTIHTQNGSENGYHKLGGTAYTIPEDFNDDYHIFGMDWSKGKIQWYVDDKIVASVDYSNDPIASKCLDRPQYIQMNLAMGGAWPGIIQEGLAGTEYAIDYVYYGQNAQQKKDAEEYYKNAPEIKKYSDVVIYEGDTDVLSNVTVSEGADIDFSITDSPNFSSKEENATAETALTSVDLICKGKNDLSKLAKLPAGEYVLYYTALPKNLKLDTMSNGVKVPSADERYKFDRKSVNLTIKERSLKTDLENSKLSLDGYANDTLKTIELPDGWSWDVPETLLTEGMGEVNVTFNKNGFEKRETVKVNVKKSISFEELEKIISEGEKYLSQTDIYTKESLENLQIAINNGKDILANQQSSTHEERIKAYTKISEGIKELVKIDATDEENPGAGQTKPEGGAKPEKPSTPNDENNGLVQTGDMNSLGFAATMLIASGVGLVALRKRKGNK